MSTNFYSNLDLRYPEIAYNQTVIDRINPGIVPFYIPVLYPNSTNSNINTQTINQSTSNLKNNSNNFTVSTMNISNSINISLPKELCGYVGGTYSHSGRSEESGSGTITHTNTNTYSATTGSNGGTSHSHSLSYNVGGGAIMTVETKIVNTNSTGKNVYVPCDNERYIDIGAAWIVVFIGGDITKPRIIARSY